MTRAREDRLAQWLLVAFLALVTLPYALAALLVPPGEVWSGLLYTPDDPNTHLMWARQARDGEFFFRDLFTTEWIGTDERPLFWNVLPAVIGWLARFSGLEVVFWYHAVRVAGAGFAFWQLHRLSLAVTRDEEKWAPARVAALTLAAFTSGAGFLQYVLPRIIWIDQPLGWFPMMPEAFLLYSALLYPLNAVSFALLAFIFTQIVRGEKPLPVAVAALFLSNIHTYDALPLVSIALIWTIWKWKTEPASAKVALGSIAGALGPILYQMIVFRDSEEFRIKALTLTLPPPIWHLTLTFLPLLILAFFGWQTLRGYPARPLLGLWIGVQIALVYTPFGVFSFARKMLEGWQLPLLVLAGVGAWTLLLKLQSARRTLVAATCLIALFLSPLSLGHFIITGILENNARYWSNLVAPLRLFASEAEALRQIERAPRFGAVLGMPYLMTYVPRATGKPTYLGHWAETLRFNLKLKQTTRFYSGQMTPDEARQFLKANHIRYLVISRFERGAFGANLDLPTLGFQPLFVGGSGDERVEVWERQS